MQPLYPGLFFIWITSPKRVMQTKRPNARWRTRITFVHLRCRFRRHTRTRRGAFLSDETLEATLEWIRESYWLKAPADVREAAFDGA